MDCKRKMARTKQMGSRAKKQGVRPLTGAKRLVREIEQELKSDALKALQEASEGLFVGMFEDMMFEDRKLCPMQAKRVTFMVKDVEVEK